MRKEREYIRKELPVAVEVEEAIQSGSEEQLRRLKKALLSLEGKQQEVIRLFYVEGYSLFEVGNILGIPSTVKSRLFHTREKLK